MMGRLIHLLVTFVVILISPASSSSLNNLIMHNNMEYLQCPSEDRIKECLKSNAYPGISQDCNGLINSCASETMSKESIIQICNDYQYEAKRPDGVVAFTAILTNNVPLSHESTIPFNNKMADPGDHFDGLHGRFICPDDDVYIFYWSIHAPWSGALGAQLTRHGEPGKVGPLTYASPTADVASGTSSMAGLERCIAGQSIWVKALLPNTCHGIVPVQSSFTGFKVALSGDETFAGFSVQLSQDYTVVEPSDPIRYDSLIFNIGTEYNPDNGIFKCQIPGVYIFTVSGHQSSPGPDHHMRLKGTGGIDYCWPAYVKNTQETPLDTGTSTGTCIMNLQLDDEVFVSGTGTQKGSGYSSLTGYRLQSTASPVAFHARIQDQANQYLNDQRIVFGDVIVNIGNDYLPGAGLFNCPDSSYYFLTWRVAITDEVAGSARRGEVKLVLYTTEEVTDYMAAPQTSQVITGTESSSSSTQAVVKCEVGQAYAVHAVVLVGDVQTYLYYESSFAGFLIPQL